MRRRCRRARCARRATSAPRPADFVNTENRHTHNNDRVKVRQSRGFGATCLSVLAVTLALAFPAVLLAAAIPTVATGVASSITTHSAVLNATVNPNGSSTTYA